MALYKATKNLVFESLGKSVIVDDVIDLKPDYAEKVNKDLKLTFPDVEAVLIAVDKTDDEVKPKKSVRRKKDDAEVLETEAE